jgi:uncharacterized protein
VTGPRRLHLLHYHYVEGILERRAPHREAHLDHVRRWHEQGRVVMAGAVGDPPHGAVFVFSVDDPAEVEAFADADPYAAAGLVTARRVEPWAVAVG